LITPSFSYLSTTSHASSFVETTCLGKPSGDSKHYIALTAGRFIFRSLVHLGTLDMELFISYFRQTTASEGLFPFYRYPLCVFFSKARYYSAARNSKVDRLNVALKKYVDEGLFEAVEVPDIASGDLTKALESVDAVIHTAAPLMGRSDAEDAFRVSKLTIVFK
jgi:hypothetical protein